MESLAAAAPPPPTARRSLRKFRAVRSVEQGKGEVIKEESVTTTPWHAAVRQSDGAPRVEVYALHNDRYPGAPGTALARAKEANVRTEQAQRREANRQNAAKAEWEHLGLGSLAKKRKRAVSRTSDAGSDSDSVDTARSRTSRTRSASSRHGTPVHLTADAPRTAGRNAPVKPSPLTVAHAP